MPAANIKINGTAASNDDVPINVLVQLDNLNVGGETSYLWQLADQPPGAADALSATNIQNPTFTPRKEGTYLARLTVNGTLVDQKVVAVRQLKTRERVPAAGETIENSSTRGWDSSGAGSMLRRLDSTYGTEAGVVVGVAGENIGRGDLVYPTGVTVVKSGLPGQESLASFVKTRISTTGGAGPIGICEGAINGDAAVASGALCRVRFHGLFSGTFAGGPAARAPVWAHRTTAGGVDLVATSQRLIGYALNPSGGQYNVFVTQAPFLDVATTGQAALVGKGQLVTLGVWRLDDIPANATTEALLYGAPGVFAPTRAGDAYIARVAVHLNAVAAGSALDVQLYDNNVAIAATLTNCALAAQNGETALLPFATRLAAGNNLRAKFITPVGWTGVTIDGLIVAEGWVF